MKNKRDKHLTGRSMIDCMTLIYADDELALAKKNIELKSVE